MHICILICYCERLSYLTQFLKGGDKVVIADNSQSTEHVYSLERESHRIHPWLQRMKLAALLSITTQRERIERWGDWWVFSSVAALGCGGTEKHELEG